MKDLIKEVALEGAEKFGVVADDSEIVDLVTWCVAELSKRAEVVAYLYKSEDPYDAGQWLVSYNKINRKEVKPLFTFPPIHDIEAIENRVAEACAKLITEKHRPFTSNWFSEGKDTYVDKIRSGEWRKYK